MKNSITVALSAYDFKTRPDGSMFWGIGSLVWGDSFDVTRVGADLYEVRVSHWLYNQYGDAVRDTAETRILRGAEALEWIFSEAPSSFWR